MAILARDTFTRTVTSGWGSADVGGAWTGVGQYTSAGRSVNGSAGILSPQNGWGGDMTLPVVVRDVAVEMTYTLTAVLGLGTIYIGAKGRISGSSDYEVAAVHNPDGTLDLTIYQDTADATLATTRLAYASWTSLGQLRLKAEIFGTSPTTIRGKLWPDGDAEPDWQVSYNAAPSGTLASPGLLGIEAYRDPGGSSTVTVAVSDYQATDWTDTPTTGLGMYVGDREVTAAYLGTTPVTRPA